MPLPVPLILAVAAGGLTVDTDSPDALCPPLDEARAVIAARVGEIQGGAYQARYRLVHDAETGARAVRLDLRDGEGTVLLVRELPLDQSTCSDVALALALVLERYFESAFELSDGAVRSAAAPETHPAEEPKTESGSSPGAEATSPSAAAPRKRKSASGEEGESLTPVLFHAGFGPMQNAALGVGLGWEVNARTWWSVALWSWFQVVPRETRDEGYLLRTMRHGIQLEPSYVVRPGSRWATYLGPDVGLQVQVVQLLEVDPSGPDSQVRLVGSAGLHGGVTFEISRRTQIGLRGRWLGLLLGQKLEVNRGSMGRQEVLSLPSMTWDAAVDWAVRF